MRRTILVLLVASLALPLGALGCKKLLARRSDAGADGGAAASMPSGEGLTFLNGFEGEIDVLVKDKHDPGVRLALFVKGGKLRLDFPEKLVTSAHGMLAPKGYGIFDSGAKKIYIVSDPQKEVLVIDLNRSGEQLKGFGGPSSHGGGGERGPQTKVTKTGQWDTVAGYKCENWDFASDHRQGSVCVAQEGVSWFHIPMTGIPTEHLWAAELLDGKHFPLRFIGYGKDGATEESRLEVTKIDKKTLAPSEFEYPPTYKVIDLAQRLQGVGAMPIMPGGGPPVLPHPAPHGNPH